MKFIIRTGKKGNNIISTEATITRSYRDDPAGNLVVMIADKFSNESWTMELTPDEIRELKNKLNQSFPEL